MPWNHLRVERPDEKSLRRRSDLDPSQRPTSFAPIPYGSETQEVRADDTPSRIRDSVVSLSAVRDRGNSLLFDRSESPPIQEKPPKQHRFSMLKFRHASDSQLSKTAKEQADAATPPVPALSTPAIITTAPTSDNMEKPKRKQAFTLPRRFRSPNKERSFVQDVSQASSIEDIRGVQSEHHQRPRLTVEDSGRLRTTFAPPAYGDESNSALALPISRLSESSRSDGSLGDHGVFATTTTTHTVSTTTTFFRLPRRKQNKGPLFPLPLKASSAEPSATNTPRLSTSGRPSQSPIRQLFTTLGDSPDMRSSKSRKDEQTSPARLVAASTMFAAPGGSILRSDSSASHRTDRSTGTNGRPKGLGLRGRSSTMSSLRRAIEDENLPTPPLPQSTRTSTSTIGARGSLGNIFSLSRLRQSSEPVFGRSGVNNSGTPGTPASTGSKQNSFSLNREPTVVIPERQEGDNPAKYLARLEEVVNRGALAALLSKSEDEFSKNVLRSYMRRFKFFEDPLDMAIRKVLMHVELPKETQQIDRTLQSFADRYHECNPGIFTSPEEAYFIAFSILILHTDVFNKNNKHKMQKGDYTKNTRGQGVAQEILECFYDNIAYTPFIHVEDDIALTTERIVTTKSRKSAFKGTGTGSLKKSGSGPVDPYALILDGKLDMLRPDLDEVLVMEDPFSYLGSGATMNLADLHRTFFRSGVIQILSSRSRPEAFMNQATITNPLEGQVGVVDMKVTKVGILWRKDPKKKKARSPWQEWGAILTGSQLYFFRNASWIRSLMAQYDHHHRHGRSSTPVVFKPPLEQFKPDFLLSTEDVVALVDSQYRKHKHAFVFTRQNVFQEVLLADSENDMNDWLAKLNYAAAFRSAGVRMRGVVGGHYEGSRATESQPRDSASSTHAAQEPKGEVSVRNGRLDDDLAQQVMVARRQIMAQKIAEANEKIAVAEHSLDVQLRNARHMKLLAPILQKTRDDVVFAAVKLAGNIRWARMEFWRIRCHRDILAMDLEEDVRLASGGDGHADEHRPSATISSPSSVQTPNKLAFGRLNSKSSTATHSTSRNSRPSTQPSGGKLFSMDDIFRSPTRLLSQHRSQGSWELPPLSFDRKGSASIASHVPPVGNGVSEANPPRLTTRTETETTVTTMNNTAHRQDDEAEHKLLVEAGLVSPDSVTSDPHNAQDVASEDDKINVLDVDANDSLSKVRHSLHRKLQSAHTPSHHRSRKGRDSSSSAAFSEDGGSITENEGLPRAKGSFTVHGKKASVINFGSEWQAMSPEERLKLRKQPGVDDSKLSVPTASEDDGSSMTSGVRPVSARSVSARSVSTTTTKSLGHLPVLEPPDSGGSLDSEASVYHDVPEARER